MDDRYDKKKESIDDILSDLNGLLNKMPSILDGIKMPEMQPAEYKPASESQAPKPAPAENIPAVPADADKTTVLQPFAGLPEGSQVPAELPAAPAPQEPAPAPAAHEDADKTMVLEPFASLSEGSQAPAEIPVPREGEEKPAALESFSGQQGWSEAAQPGDQAAGEKRAAASEQEKLVPQSLGDFMFGEEAQQEARQAQQEATPEPEPATLSGAPLEPPAEEQFPAEEAGPALSIPEVTPPAEPQAAQEISPAAATEAPLAGASEPAPGLMTFAETADSSDDGEASSIKTAPGLEFGNTGDLGIPDIDALMQMSGDEKPAEEQPVQPLPEAGLIPEAVQAPENEKGGRELPDLAGGFPEEVNEVPAQAEGEPQSPAALPEEGNIMEADKPKEETTENPQPEAVPAAMEPGAFIIEPEAKPETSFDAFTIEPSSPEPEPAQEAAVSPEPAQEAAVSPEPAPETQPLPAAEETLNLEPAPVPAPEPGPAEEDIQFGAFTLPEPEVKPSAEPAAEPALEVVQPMQFGSGAPEPAAGGIELSPGIELGGGPSLTVGSDATIPGGFGFAPATPSGDETLVVPPSSGDEEKTVIFQANPAATSRAQAGDLASLSVKTVPEGIPAERVRTLAFLYSPGDETLCATVLAELDAICLKSATKPMFIKRAYVKECDIDANPNVVHQSVADAGAAGLVCVGAVPQEKIYEIENAFASSGGFFRYYDPSAFTHSSALDLVADLIVR